MNNKIIGMAFATVFASTAVQATPIMIDDFDGATQASTAPGTGIGFGIASGGAAYARTLDKVSSGNFTDTSINAVATPGKFAHSQGSGIFGSSQVNYALGGIDLDGTGAIGDADAFRFELTQNDFSYPLSVFVDGIQSTQIIPAGTIGGSMDFLFSSFVGVNWDSVTTVSFLIDGNAQDDLDARLDNFETVCTINCTPVPEPASIALLGLGIAGIGFGRRKLK